MHTQYTRHVLLALNRQPQMKIPTFPGLGKVAPPENEKTSLTYQLHSALFSGLPPIYKFPSLLLRPLSAKHSRAQQTFPGSHFSNHLSLKCPAWRRKFIHFLSAQLSLSHSLSLSVPRQSRWQINEQKENIFHYSPHLSEWNDAKLSERVASGEINYSEHETLETSIIPH